MIGHSNNKLKNNNNWMNKKKESFTYKIDSII